MSTKEISVEKKLRTLFNLQLVDSRIDEIKGIRGELPIEVENLKKEVEQLQNLLEKSDSIIEEYNQTISKNKNTITNAKALIKKYEEQIKTVRNNREYNSLSKEQEYQKLEIEFHEKNNLKLIDKIERKKEEIEKVKEQVDNKKKHLLHKNKELENILVETEKEEKALLKKSEDFQKNIDENLLFIYNRIRRRVVNGLAIVPIEKGAAKGSNFIIPDQKQLEIAAREKIIVDEHSGRILVDIELAAEEEKKIEALIKKL